MRATAERVIVGRTFEAMTEDVTDAVRNEVVSAIARLWDEGCPVASRPEEMAPIAIRRWMSAERRGVKASDPQARRRDLTKGLIAHFEKEPALVGPLRSDYECVAERVATILGERGGV